MKKLTILIILAIFIVGCTKKESWVGIQVKDVKHPEILLSGTWKFSMNPPVDFQKNELQTGNWRTIKVPGECAMQGFAIKHDQPFVYNKQFLIPADYHNKKVQLRFDGVYSYARVWVNGQYIRDHSGGFTRWTCDIEKAAQPGKINNLTVEVTDKADEISYASGYAKHQIGGILRNVYLTVKPQNHLKFFHIETRLDRHYENASLIISLGAITRKNLTVKFFLTDPDGIPVKLNAHAETLTREHNEKIVTIPVLNPLKWDAEHPNLYTLAYEIFEEGKLGYSQSQKIGFREIRISGNKMLVNGKEVKLRGACRHDINPVLGRITTQKEDKQDVLLAKEANINFIRTSHYPPSETFVEYCDLYGIYLESESAVCFVNSFRTKSYKPGNSQSDPNYTSKYLSQLEEMVESFRNHPSVIIWSIGNENTYGSNFKKSYDWVKSHDPTRPLIFSFPGSVPDSIRCYDILSMHYPSWEGDLNQWGKQISGFRSDTIPVLFDEWAHVPCYNKATLQIDPNVRNFWGESLDRMWSGAFNAEGSLGGAIWGMIDETFMLPDTLSGFNKWWGRSDKNILPSPYESNDVGYGEWGIIDTWRRKKPEFWSAKKAYSPTKIFIKRIETFEDGETLKIPVYNRFDHTDFSELKIKWKYENRSGILKNITLPPHNRGELPVPVNHWEAGRILYISFYKDKGRLIDKYALPLGHPTDRTPRFNKNTRSLKIYENDSSIHISGESFSMNLSKTLGLIKSYSVNKHELISSGPWLNLRTRSNPDSYNTRIIQDVQTTWIPDEVSAETSDTLVTLMAKGHYDTISVQYKITINGEGRLKINYKLENSIHDPIRELGLLFQLTDSFDKLFWKRKTYWTLYPKNHIGKAAGMVSLLNQSALPAYREKPQSSWASDTWDIYYLGMPPSGIGPYLSNIAKATKENIYFYQLSISSSKAGLCVLSNGTSACRISRETDGHLALFIDNLWDYVNISWGNYWKMIETDSLYANSILIEPSK